MNISVPAVSFNDFVIGDRVSFPTGDDVAAGEGRVYWLYPQGNTLVQLDDGAVILRKRGELQYVECPRPELLVRSGSETGEARALLALPDATQTFKLVDPLKGNQVLCSGGTAAELEAALLRLGYWVDRAYLKDALVGAIHIGRLPSRPGSAAAALGRRGGVARAYELTAEQRTEIARKGGLSGGRGRPANSPKVRRRGKAPLDQTLNE